MNNQTPVVEVRCAHTPGPWEAVVGEIVATKTIRGNGRFVICQLDRDDAPLSENIANTRLIAAAPELLELARDVVCARTQHLDHMAFYRAMDRIADLAHSLIAKAEGRS